MNPVVLSRRLLAVSILIIVVLVSFYLFVYPLVQFISSIGREQQQIVTLLTSYKQILSNSSEWEKFSKRLDEDRTASLFLSGVDSSLAPVRLQSIVKQIIEESGGNIKSSQIIPMSDKGPLKRVAVRINFLVPMECLLKVLLPVEKAPFLYIDTLTIHAPEFDQRREKRPVVLQISADYYAFVVS